MLFNCYLWIFVQLQFNAKPWKFFSLLVCFGFICTKSDDTQIGQSYICDCVSLEPPHSYIAPNETLSLWPFWQFNLFYTCGCSLVGWFVCLLPASPLKLKPCYPDWLRRLSLLSQKVRGYCNGDCKAAGQEPPAHHEIWEEEELVFHGNN